MSKFVKKFLTVQRRNYSGGHVKSGEKIRTTKEIAEACKNAAEIYGPSFFKFLSKRETGAGDE